MDLLEKMENESNCVESIFQSYITSKNEYKIFLFFEGRDDRSYYSSKITMFTEEEVRSYLCNSKKNVLKIHAMISEQAAKKENKKTLYFVDCDYDNNKNISDSIYVTSSYSIENYYFTDSAIKRILKGVAGLSDENEIDKRDFEKTFEYLKGERDKIIEEVIYGNAWYSLQIKKSEKCSVAPRMSDLRDYDSIKNINSISELENKVKNPIRITDKEIYEEIEVIRINAVDKIRGKYLTQAMKPVFKKLFQDAGKKNNREWFNKRRVIRLVFDDILCELSTYADIPHQLRSYIKIRLS